IHRGSPGCTVSIGKVSRVKASEVAAVRSEVVVDDVEQDGHAEGVSRIYQPTKMVGSPVAPGRCEKVHSVVSPVATTGEVGDWHQLDGRDSQADQLGQPVGNPGERPLGRERANVQLVDHQVAAGNPFPGSIGPRERAGIEDLRGSMDTL